MTGRPLLTGAAILAITLLQFFVHPGHTFLHSDTQIYAPLLDRLYDPTLYARDFAAPHLSYTIYDETALALRRITGLELEYVLFFQQFVFRALGVLGLFLIAAAMGLGTPAALGVAAICSLGATISGPAVLLVEAEPVPRGFAIALTIFAAGLAAHGRVLWAGAAGSLAFLYHAPAAYPLWVVFAVMVIARRLSWRVFIPLGAAAGLLGILAGTQAGVVEPQPLFSRIDELHERLQRFRASYNWVSSWRSRTLASYAVLTAICAAAWFRLRAKTPPVLQWILAGLPIVGLISIPVSWLLTENLKWALMPQIQPARATLFLYFSAIVMAAVAGSRAAAGRRWLEALIWYFAAVLPAINGLALPHLFNRTQFLVVLGLAVVWTLAQRVWLVPAAAAISFAALPYLANVRVYPPVGNPETLELAAWAKSETPIDAVFLFPDAGTSLEPGVFRVRARRAVYVDWKAGGQINYFPQLGREWWRRWTETGSGRWSPVLSDMESIAARGIDFIAVRPEHRIAGMAPAHENAKWVAYRVR